MSSSDGDPYSLVNCTPSIYLISERKAGKHEVLPGLNNAVDEESQPQAVSTYSLACMMEEVQRVMHACMTESAVIRTHDC